MNRRDQKGFKYAGYNFKMDNIDDPETNAKISDSAYSNSCSNSQSRRSHSSKSTHSGSNSSGSSGYGGKASTSGSSNILGQPPKKDKESKKKKQIQTEVKKADTAPVDEPARPAEPDPILAVPNEESENVVESAMAIALPEMVAKEKEASMPEPSLLNDEALNALQPVTSGEHYVTSHPSLPNVTDGFSCAISMHDGVVMYTSDSITTTLGFPKDIWIGRSFIDFVHPRDHKTFSSLITNGLAIPKLENGLRNIEEQGFITGSTMVCRIRRYRSLNSNFGVKDGVISFTPFLLKFCFKDFCDNDQKVIYLVIQATSFLSAFKTPNELVTKPTSFVIRHGADGILKYIDPESVPYMGYLPQEIQDKNALHLFHPDDLPYLKQVYESIVKEEKVSSSRPYRLMTQNGDFIKVETEWSSVINPWSMKLEFVIAKHHIIEGPANPDVFQSPTMEKTIKTLDAEKYRIQAYRDSIIRVLNEIRSKPTETSKHHLGKRCQDLVSFIETLIVETPKQEEELRLQIQEIHDRELSYYERDSVMLGGISPHHDSDSKSSTETPLSYNQLNYNDNLQRFFSSQEPHCYENYNPVAGPVNPELEAQKPFSSKCFSPVEQNSYEFNDQSTSSSAVVFCSSPSPAPDTHYLKLTENMIYKHNAEMERELVKMHRESRSSKGDREKASNESRKNKKEHLERCNAIFHPTAAGDVSTECARRLEKPRGVKRPSKPQYTDSNAHKHHCPSPRESHHHHHYPPGPPLPNNSSVAYTSTLASSNWSTPQTVNSYNMYGMGMPHQMPMIGHMPVMTVPRLMPTTPTSSVNPNITGIPPTASTPTMPMPGRSIMDPRPSTSTMPPMSGAYGMHGIHPGMPVMAGMPGMYPVYYASTASPMPTAATPPHPQHVYQPFEPSLPYMVHPGHSLPMMYGQPFVYSPVNPQLYSMQQNLLAQQNMTYPPKSINLSTSNYEQSSELVQSSSTSYDKSKNTRTSDENTDRTDGESSYSSFYSSFFKTDSGSADDSGDQVKKTIEVKNRFWTKNVQGDDAMSFQSSGGSSPSAKARNSKKLARRRMKAPWNEEVDLTPDLIYRYQVSTQPLDEVLESDRKKLAAMDKQPELVNEQLGQLYLDLQLQGVAERLTLEEGITSSSSSGEETTTKTVKVRRKREFSRLSIIHEENAPLPSPGSGPPAPEGPPDTDIVPTIVIVHPTT